MSDQAKSSVTASEPAAGFTPGLAYEFDHDPFDNAGGNGT
jgi:hypothetical protein